MANEIGLNFLSIKLQTVEVNEFHMEARVRKKALPSCSPKGNLKTPGT